MCYKFINSPLNNPKLELDLERRKHVIESLTANIGETSSAANFGQFPDEFSCIFW